MSGRDGSGGGGATERERDAPLFCPVGLLGDFAGHDDDGAFSCCAAVARVDVAFEVGPINQKERVSEAMWVGYRLEGYGI